MNTAKRIGIIVTKKSDGIAILNNIIGEMKYKDVDSIYLAQGIASLKNGDVYKVIVMRDPDSVRGYRFNKVIISTNIDIVTINHVLPFILSYSPKETDDISDLIEYFDPRFIYDYSRS